MTRRIIFTRMFNRLLTQMLLDEGWALYPAIAYVRRSTEEQQRLFKEKASKLDGVKKISAHQNSMAADIDLYDKDGNYLKEWPPEFAKKYHDLWESWGGCPLIGWDVNHFEFPK